MLEMESSSHAYAASGSAGDKAAFDGAARRAAEARAEFSREAYGRMVAYRNSESKWIDVCFLEAILMETIDRLSLAADNSTPTSRVEAGHVVSLNFLGSYLEQRPVADFVSLAIRNLRNLSSLAIDGLNVPSVPFLPDRLKRFRCEFSFLVQLPSSLPDGLEQLHVDANLSLRLLPKLPSSLLILSCSGSSIADLPELPPRLEKLKMRASNLARLPTLPDSLRVIDISDTPAAEDPSIIARLEAFKTAHPDAIVRY